MMVYHGDRQKFPCLFNGLYMPKAAFYAVIDAKKQYWD